MTTQTQVFAPSGARRFGPSTTRARTASGARASGPRNRPSALVAHRRPAPPAAACAVEDTEQPYRMGRWARLGMTVIVVAAIIVGSITIAWHPASTPTVPVTVAPGESLQSIVVRDLPDRDPADAIRLVQQINGLASPVVPAGTVLQIPAR